MFGKLNHITLILLSVVVLLWHAGCSDDFRDSLGSSDVATVTFLTTLDKAIQTRTISDGSNVDKLLVNVYEVDDMDNNVEGSKRVRIFSREYDLSNVLHTGVDLRLLSGHHYEVLFWAYDGDNTAYSVEADGTIKADYSNYYNRGFAGMEQLDAFYAVSSVTVSCGNENKSITLTRPFAQLNFADDATRPVAGTHKCEMTLNSVATSFNPFSGNAGTGSEATQQNVTFSFADFPEETLVSDGSVYYYVATNYLFVPESGSVSAALKLKQANTETVITERVLSSIGIAANKRTNVLGAIVQQPEDIWDGVTLKMPEQDEQNRYVIDEASDLAWLANNGGSLSQNSTFVVVKDLNLNNNPINCVRLPEGSKIEGEGHTIKNVAVTGGGLFGDVVDFSISNLTIDIIKTTNASGHVGALVNTLKGNGSFNNVTVKNAVVSTTNGAAGGIVGYVVRKSENNRSEMLSLSFNGCKIESSSVSGSASEGKFVGLLSGYDNNEKLSFDTACSASEVTIADHKSPYAEGNEGAWLASNDYSKYDGWLGDETYCRGSVNYGGNRFIPCWDGIKKVTPLTNSDGTKLIYSAFDLAALQGGSHSAVTFKENVDLGGKMSDDPNDDSKGFNRFTPISSISNLDGEGHTLYRMYIHVLNCDYWVGAGFILGISGATSHKNLKFDGAQIIVTHRDTDDDGGARAGTLLPTVENGNYTAQNIHARNGYLYSVNKSGGLFGYIAAPQFNVSDCSIDNYTFKNYNSGKKYKFGFLANGEIGGMFGFLAANSEINNCKVTNSTFNCIGVNDATPSGVLGIVGEIVGRHVNGFIGDIRTASGQIIKINNCNTSGNTFANGFRNEDKYSHTYTYYTKDGQISENWKWGWTKKEIPYNADIVGCCYYIYLDFGVVSIKDVCGKLFVDGNEIKICKNHT